MWHRHWWCIVLLLLYDNVGDGGCSFVERKKDRGSGKIDIRVIKGYLWCFATSCRNLDSQLWGKKKKGKNSKTKIKYIHDMTSLTRLLINNYS